MAPDPIRRREQNRIAQRNFRARKRAEQKGDQESNPSQSSVSRLRRSPRNLKSLESHSEPQSSLSTHSSPRSFETWSIRQHSPKISAPNVPQKQLSALQPLPEDPSRYFVDTSNNDSPRWSKENSMALDTQSHGKFWMQQPDMVQGHVAEKVGVFGANNATSPGGSTESLTTPSALQTSNNSLFGLVRGMLDNHERVAMAKMNLEREKVGLDVKKFEHVCDLADHMLRMARHQSQQVLPL